MEKIKKLLKYVSENVPYYIDYFSQNDKDPLQIESYPILCRKDYIDNYDRLISREVDKRQLLLSSTSGTTGIPLKIVRTNKEYYNQVLALWRIRRQFYDITPSSLCLRFCLTKEEADLAKNGVIFEQVNEMVISLFDIDNKINTDNILRVFNKIKPMFIRSTPTAICKFIMLNKNKGISNCDFIHYIESHSEYLFDFQRDMMNEFFNKAKISNEYGCTEILGIAQEIPGFKGLQVLSDNVYVEIYDDNKKLTVMDNKEGDLIITGLNSFSMPFIRYRIGDRGKFVNYEDCDLNRKAIEVLAGRTSDYITYSNGQKEHCVVLARAIRKCNEQINQIIKFKFVQKTVNSFDLFLTIKDINLKNEVEKAFINYVRVTNLSVFKWNLWFVDFDDFNQRKSKFSYFESEIISS